MNRLLTLGGLIGLLLLTAGLAVAEESTAAADTSWMRIGTIENDVLVVQRDLVVAAALEHNEMLAASSAMRDAADADALGALRGFLPQIQLGEYFMRSDDALNVFGFKLQNRGVTPMDFGITPTGFESDLINQPGELNNFITRVQLLQPIFNGGMGIYGKQAANAMGRAAGFEHARAEETIRFHAIQAFEGLTLASAYEGVMEAAVASAEGHVRQARSMVDNDMATEADLLQAKVYLSTLLQKLIEIRNLMAVAGENIKLLTAVNVNLPLATNGSGGNDAGEMLLPDFPEYFNLDAIQYRNDLQAQREKAVAAGKMVGVATGSLLPHVNLSIQKDWYDLENLFGNNSNSWTLGVYATMGFGIQNVSEIKKAKAQRRAADYMVDFETRQARVQATEALLGARAAHEKVLVARDAVQAARSGLKIVTNQYREGLASMVNLLDTQAYAIQAEGNLVQALHDFSVGLANLEFAGAVKPTDAADNNQATTTPLGQ
jgi:outer membrane protein